MRATCSLALSLVLSTGACRHDSAEPNSVGLVDDESVADSRGGIRPYDPSRKHKLDFTGVDVGDEPLDGAADSMDALGASLVEALNARDDAALRNRAVHEDEYARLYPVLINHRSAAKAGHELAWRTLSIESSGDLQTALREHGGQDLSFVRLEPQGLKQRPKVRIHVNPRVVVQDAEGHEHSLVMLGPVLEHVPSGGFKVLAYRDTP